MADDKTARTILLTSMEPDLEIIYEEYEHTKEMYESIVEAYGTMSESYVQLLIEKFNSIKMKEGESVVDHVNKMLVIAKELAAVGNPILEKMQVLTVLHSLRASWDSVVVAINFSGKEVDMRTPPLKLSVEYERKLKRNSQRQC
ncbi:uncharacterized protein LOC143855422 [Tasmannia lanceolata]|uniref:uncharacterized protein LOC143855422 n=1 Tax=Tasmannia lanceolata TaxID=3420 RepID=UPI00406323A9